MMEVGTTVPSVAAPDDTGAIVNLADLIGKPFVVWFYPRASTPG